MQPGVNALVPAHKLPDSWLEANFVRKSITPKATSSRDQDRVDQWPAALLRYQPVEAVCHLRWGVETPYDIPKNGWELKNFSGIRLEVIAQEHQATVVTRNLAAPVEHEAQKQWEERRARGEVRRKLAKDKITTSVAVGLKKDRWTNRRS
ncbi:MAG: hypothetical protein M1600_14170 [Firmicutes bacterium]|nr:hypothetical protein [Bacillota bacterium]